MKFQDMQYTRISQEELEKGFEDLIRRQKEAKSGQEQFEIHREYYRFYGHIETMFVLCSIRHSVDTTDEFYEKENDYCDELAPILEKYNTLYGETLYDSPYRAELEKKIGAVAFQNIELRRRAFDEKLIPLMQEENQLSTRYDKLIATAKIPFEGEIYNLSLMRKFTVSPDREVRKAAQKAISDWFLSVTEEIDEIYDRMVKNRTEQARILGFENYIPLGYLRMQRNSYGREEVENFRRQVKESFVPFVGEIQEKRRQRLGLDHLYGYDNGVFFPEGNPEPKGTPEEILAGGQAMYHELSPETAEFFDFMMENELFDVLGRKTKEAGGYMTYLYDYQSPFIFANFNGTSSDIDVITHECGHAFQGYLTRTDEIREHADLTMETAEIHSMSMEYFTYGWMKRFFGEDADRYLTMHLEDSIIFIPYGCMVDEFQHLVYAKPEMTPAQRKETWKKLEETYRPWLDYGDDPFFSNGGYWQRQGHIFDSPFYYIDYVLASVSAMQYKLWMDRDYRDAWEHYLKLCRFSAGDFYGGILKEGGIRSPFQDGCIEAVTEGLRAIAR